MPTGAFRAGRDAAAQRVAGHHRTLIKAGVTEDSVTESRAKLLLEVAGLLADTIDTLSFAFGFYPLRQISHVSSYEAMVAPGTRRAVFEVALFLASQAALFYTVRWVIDSIASPDKKEEVKTKQLEALKRLGHSSLVLDEYEKKVANEVIHPDDINVRFSDIGGLDQIISSLRESVIYPLLYPNLFTSSSSLLGAPKGVLLFGPPGCGKTMLAKALAKESGATFINIAASVLTNKWYGESNKLVAGLFSLARKVQPSIIFIDEIDSFLRERTKGDHEVTGMMKAEFMTLWDGLTSSTDRILVLGATNRPNDIDSAILRRMPKRFAVGLPGFEQRLRILNLMLKDTQLAQGFQMASLAEITEGHSGSDLREICRNAAMVPVREFMRSADGHEELLAKGQLEGFKLRPLVLEDFFVQDGTSPLPPPVVNMEEIVRQLEEEGKPSLD